MREGYRYLSHLPRGSALAEETDKCIDRLHYAWGSDDEEYLGIAAFVIGMQARKLRMTPIGMVLAKMDLGLCKGNMIPISLAAAHYLQERNDFDPGCQVTRETPARVPLGGVRGLIGNLG